MRHATAYSNNTASAESGFTLIEMLVALTILAVSLSVLFAVFSHSLSRNEESQRRMAARTLASSLLAQAEAAPTLSMRETDGRANGGLEWRLDVRPYGSEQDRQAWPANAAQISATVVWGERGPGQTLTLSTLRLLPKEPKS